MREALVSVLVVGVYFLPALIANHRRHQNNNSIAVINLFFGWTIVGWVICLAWSLSGTVVSTERK